MLSFYKKWDKEYNMLTTRISHWIFNEKFHNEKYAKRLDGSKDNLKEPNELISSVNLETAFHSLLKSSIGFRISIARNDYDLSFAVFLPFVNTYFSIENKYLSKIIKKFPKLECNFEERNCANGGTDALHFRICFNPEYPHISGGYWHYAINDHIEGRSERRFYINYIDLLLGKSRYSEKVIKETHNVEITLPEGKYPATCEMKDCYWKRPRWPFTKTIRRAFIEIENGIPIPGKGENSWDCEDDAIFGHTGPAESFRDAEKQLVFSILETRFKHAGLDWKPVKGWDSFKRVKVSEEDACEQS